MLVACVCVRACVCVSVRVVMNVYGYVCDGSCVNGYEFFTRYFNIRVSVYKTFESELNSTMKGLL